MLATPLLMSLVYDFSGMFGFEPKELAVTSMRATILATHPSHLTIATHPSERSKQPIPVPTPTLPTIPLATYPPTLTTHTSN